MTEQQSMDNLKDDMLAAKQLPKDGRGLRLWPGCKVDYKKKTWTVAYISHSKRLILTRQELGGGETEDAAGAWVRRVDA